MKSIHTKLVLSAIGLALLATPALAQRAHRPSTQTQQYSGSNYGSGTYPNPEVRSGSQGSFDSGTEFGLGR